MRDKVVIFILIIIFLALLSGVMKKEMKNTEIYRTSVSMSDIDELSIFMKLENEVAAESWRVYNTMMPYSKTDSSASKDVNKEPEYINNYPKLYTEPLTETECTDSEQKICYLSFDDGPSDLTWEVLKILDDKEVKATFFIIGEEVNEYSAECLKEAVNRGHVLGLHSYCHEYNKIYRSVDAFLADYEQDCEAVYRASGVKPNIYRFPGGSYNKYVKRIKNQVVEEMSRRGFTYFDWNVSAEDMVGKPTLTSIKRNVKKDVFRFKYPVVLMHDTKMNELTVKALPELIDLIKSEGYIFDTLNHRKPCQFTW